jgi:hypothetical protein
MMIFKGFGASGVVLEHSVLGYGGYKNFIYNMGINEKHQTAFVNDGILCPSGYCLYLLVSHSSPLKRNTFINSSNFRITITISNVHIGS